jgi:potassium-transporting ATPase KdpC subunit
MMFKQIKIALKLFFLMVILTGVMYPLAVTGLAQILFPHQANGSLILKNGKIMGSSLIGQSFSDPKYFWGRLSDTEGQPYNAAASGASNYSVLNDKLITQVQDRISALKAADPTNSQPIPVDLVTASASGLDPNISLAAAQYQAGRIASVRNLSLDTVNQLINQHTQNRDLGFLGETRVNVLELNFALDGLK